MPLYEYQCESCSARFERIQKWSDPPETICPTCGGPVKKLLSSPAIQFKGSGFYITDYAKKGDKRSESSAGSSSSDSSSSGSSSSASDGSSSSKDSSSKDSSSKESGGSSTGSGSGDSGSKESAKPAAATSDSSKK